MGGGMESLEYANRDTDGWVREERERKQAEAVPWIAMGSALCWWLGALGIGALYPPGWFGWVVTLCLTARAMITPRVEAKGGKGGHPDANGGAGGDVDGGRVDWGSVGVVVVYSWVGGARGGNRNRARGEADVWELAEQQDGGEGVADRAGLVGGGGGGRAGTAKRGNLAGVEPLKAAGGDGMKVAAGSAGGKCGGR